MQLLLISQLSIIFIAMINILKMQLLLYFLSFTDTYHDCQIRTDYDNPSNNVYNFLSKKSFTSFL